MVLKCAHYITRITLNVSQIGCTVASQLRFEPSSLVWQASSLPTKPSRQSSEELLNLVKIDSMLVRLVSIIFTSKFIKTPDAVSHTGATKHHKQRCSPPMKQYHTPSVSRHSSQQLPLTFHRWMFLLMQTQNQYLHHVWLPSVSLEWKYSNMTFVHF